MRKEASFISVATAITLATVGVGGGMYVGALATDVETLQEAQKTVKEDHDRLIEVKNEVKHVKDDVTDVKADVKLILAAVQEIQRTQESND
jgi:hypothetical protein